MSELPEEAVPVFGALVEELIGQGWSVSRAAYSAESFGNLVIELGKDSTWLRLTRDRGDLIIDGPDHSALRQAGLFRAFHDADEFRAAVVGWLRSVAP